MRREYLKLGTSEEIIVARDALESFRNIDAVIFDCDGVLIDARGSYDKAILMTIEEILSKMLHVEFLGQPVTSEEIRLLRSTGGFNNDANTAYILTLWLFVNLPDEVISKFGKSIINLDKDSKTRPDSLFRQISRDMLLVSGYVPLVVKDMKYLLKDVVDRARRLSSQLITPEMLEKAIREIAIERGFLTEYEFFLQILGQPGNYGDGLLETTFSDLYYGEDIVSKIYGRGPFFRFGEGLFRNETIFIGEETLKKLSAKIGRRRLSIVSGRDRAVSEIVLGRLMDYFNSEASIFIADEERLGAPKSIEKPSPYSLIKSASIMNDVSRIVYVGNSIEDLMMAKNANNFGLKTMFIAVTGLSHNPKIDREMFISMGSDAIIHTTDSLIYLLGEV